MSEPIESSIFWLEFDLHQIRLIRRVSYFLKEDDSNDKAINTQNTSHDYWDNRFDDHIWLEDTHGRNTDTTLSGSISCSEVYRN